MWHRSGIAGLAAVSGQGFVASSPSSRTSQSCQVWHEVCGVHIMSSLGTEYSREKVLNTKTSDADSDHDMKLNNQNSYSNDGSIGRLTTASLGKQHLHVTRAA